MANPKFKKFISERTKALAGKKRNLTTMLGYIGESDRKGYTRLFVSPKYDFWVDILDDHIHHIEEISTDKYQLGGNIVWVQKRPDIIPNFDDIIELTQAGGPFGDLSGPISEAPIEGESTAFASTLICATISITYTLCLTPSCADTTINPAACYGGGDDDDDDETEGGEGTDPDKDEDEDTPETESPELF